VKLIVISPENEDPREQPVLADLFAAGLVSYHLRKPTWTRGQLAGWLHALAPRFHPRIVLHTHHDLAADFPLAGLHHREANEPICHLISDKFGSNEVLDKKGEKPVCNLLSDKFSEVGSGLLRSRAVHDLATLKGSLESYHRLLVSPVFPSFSKPGYGPSEKLPDAGLRAALALPRRAEVIALGGIDVSRIAACRELGFDGVAVLGAMWQADDPVLAFEQLIRAAAEVTRPSPSASATQTSLVTPAATLI
jgi:thiamine-phosphate pyrophosphorylase